MCWEPDPPPPPSSREVLFLNYAHAFAWYLAAGSQSLSYTMDRTFEVLSPQKSNRQKDPRQRIHLKNQALFTKKIKVKN